MIWGSSSEVPLGTVDRASVGVQKIGGSSPSFPFVAVAQLARALRCGRRDWGSTPHGHPMYKNWVYVNLVDGLVWDQAAAGSNPATQNGDQS